MALYSMRHLIPLLLAFYFPFIAQTSFADEINLNCNTVHSVELFVHFEKKVLVATEAGILPYVDFQTLSERREQKIQSKHVFLVNGEPITLDCKVYASNTMLTFEFNNEEDATRFARSICPDKLVDSPTNVKSF